MHCAKSGGGAKKVCSREYFVSRRSARIFHIPGGTCRSLNGRAALPRGPGLGRSSSFALPNYEYPAPAISPRAFLAGLCERKNSGGVRGWHSSS